MTNAQHIAEIIHERMCHWNHTDGCAWYYDTWEDEKLRGSRQTYFEKAESILAVVSYETALKVVELI